MITRTSPAGPVAWCIRSPDGASVRDNRVYHLRGRSPCAHERPGRTGCGSGPGRNRGTCQLGTGGTGVGRARAGRTKLPSRPDRAGAPRVSTARTGSARYLRICARLIETATKIRPVSVAIHGNLVYVLNALDGGSVQGYRLFFGRLFRFPGRPPPVRGAPGGLPALHRVPRPDAEDHRAHRHPHGR